MNSTQSLHLTVPLSKDAHHWAEQFAAEQVTLQKGKQVYLNTLAVYAVHSYLKWLPIETDLTGSESWHPGLRAIFDVADLVLPNIGKLECRPVLPGETALIVPPEVTQNRMGYIAVGFNEELDRVQLLGFAPANAITDPPTPLPLAKLQSLDTLIDTIYRSPLQQVHQPEIQPEGLLVHLWQWLEGVFNEDWQVPSLVLATGNFRSTPLELNEQTDSLSRAKAIALGSETVILVVQLTPETTETISIRLRLYPGEDAIHLPPDLQLIVLDETETPCMEARTRSSDNWIQLEFSCHYQERFSVSVVLGEMSVTQQFVV